MADPYAVLGLPRSADAADIRRAYRELALRHHPDRNPTDCKARSVARFQQVAAAYAVLSDPLARRKVDSERQTAAPPAATSHETSPSRPRKTRTRDSIVDDLAFASAYPQDAPPTSARPKARKTTQEGCSEPPKPPKTPKPPAFKPTGAVPGAGGSKSSAFTHGGSFWQASAIATATVPTVTVSVTLEELFASAAKDIVYTRTELFSNAASTLATPRRVQSRARVQLDARTHVDGSVIAVPNAGDELLVDAPSRHGPQRAAAAAAAAGSRVGSGRRFADLHVRVRIDAHPRLEWRGGADIIARIPAPAADAAVGAVDAAGPLLQTVVGIDGRVLDCRRGLRRASAAHSGAEEIVLRGEGWWLAGGEDAVVSTARGDLVVLLGRSIPCEKRTRDGASAEELASAHTEAGDSDDDLVFSKSINRDIAQDSLFAEAKNGDGCDGNGNGTGSFQTSRKRKPSGHKKEPSKRVRHDTNRSAEDSSYPSIIKGVFGYFVVSGKGVEEDPLLVE
ncbi:hypothetical protein HDU83_008467 [Entophlyctis luteolus]|nr:hypothetical protein HDU83_008467 [Entophlyctis luteolus]